MVGRSVGWRGVGRRRALLDGERRTDGSFYFFLEPPNKGALWDRNLFVSRSLDKVICLQRSANV